MGAAGQAARGGTAGRAGATRALLWRQMQRAVGTGPAEGGWQAPLPPLGFLRQVPRAGGTGRVRAGPRPGAVRGFGKLLCLPRGRAARLGLAAGGRHLALPRLLARRAGCGVLPGWGAQREQGAANTAPQSPARAAPRPPDARPGQAGLRAPGSSSELTCRCSPSPAGPPAASAPRRRGRRRTGRAQARAPGTLGHSAAPPRSLGGRQPSATLASAPPTRSARAHRHSPLHPRRLPGPPHRGREPSPVHLAPLPGSGAAHLPRAALRCAPRPRDPRLPPPPQRMSAHPSHSPGDPPSPAHISPLGTPRNRPSWCTPV